MALTNLGTPIDAGDYDGRTPLHLAVCEDRVSVVKFLLSKVRTTTANTKYSRADESENSRVCYVNKVLCEVLG